MEDTASTISTQVEANSNTPFSRLPWELVLQIVEELPLDSAIALALTSHDLYNSKVLQKVWKPAVHQNPPQFARAVARYSPDWTYCWACDRLHRRRSTPKITSEWFNLQTCSNDNAGMSQCSYDGLWLHFDPWNYHIQFEDVDNVMTRHRRGEPYGASLSSLAVQTDWQIMRSGPSWRTQCLTRLDVTPQIVNDNLVLQTTQHVWYHPHRLDSLLDGDFGCHPFRYCQHCDWDLVSASVAEFERSAWQITNRSRDFGRYIKQSLHSVSAERSPWPGYKGRTFRRGSRLSCDYCLTKYRVGVWNHGRAGIEIALYTCTDLGACRAPYDVEWSLAVYREGSILNDRIYRLTHDRSSVKRLPTFGHYGHIKKRHSDLCCESFKAALDQLNARSAPVFVEEELFEAIQGLQDKQRAKLAESRKSIGNKKTGISGYARRLWDLARRRTA